jgi:EpsI family protein
VPADGWHPSFAGADTELRRTYAGPDGAVQLYIAYFTTQRHGAKIISAENRIDGEKTWHRATTGSTAATIDGRTLTVATQMLTSDSRTRRLAWIVYWVDGRFTGRPLEAKLLGARGTLLSGHPQAAAIVLAADVTGTEAAAAARIQDLLRNIEPLAGVFRRAAAP